MSERDTLAALARQGAAYMHLNGVGLLSDHRGRFDECPDPRCVGWRETIAAEAATPAPALDVERLRAADEDVSLVHDFLYGRGHTMDEAHAACWRIHGVLRPIIAEALK